MKTHNQDNALISEEEWEKEKFQGWNRWHCLRKLTTDDMYVGDKNQNILALIVGEKMFLNTDFIHNIDGTYSEKQMPEDDPAPVTI